MQRTLLIIKPDGVKRGLIGEILARIERKGFTISALKMMTLTRKTAEELYEPHAGRDFFKPLVEFMVSGPIVAVVVEGESAVEIVRMMIGATDPLKSEPGSIRGDFSISNRENVVHASDSVESFERESAIIFSPEEIGKNA